MSDLTTKEAQLEKMVEQTTLLKENIQSMVAILTPVGSVQAFAGTTTPDGWLLCDGSAVSRTDYADLYAVIGDTYGDGDGVDTFNLPDLADKFIEGSATSGTVKSAGLPNITGTFGSTTLYYNSSFAAGAVEKEEYLAYSPATGSSAGTRFSFDASKSNDIYGGSTTVQPPALTMLYVIKY